MATPLASERKSVAKVCIASCFQAMPALRKLLYQFPLLGVYADDGVPLADEFVPTTANESELPVVLTWRRRRAFLMIDTQPEIQLLEESAHGVSTHLSLAVIPRLASALAIFFVVLRVHFRPPIGSPAVSYFISCLISAMTSGVFFPRAGGQHPPFGYD